MSVPFSKESQEKLDEIRKKEEEDLIAVLSKKYGIDHANLFETGVKTDALRLIPEEDARAAEVAAFKKRSSDVALALRTPNSDKTKEVIRDLKDRGFRVTLYMVSNASLEYAWSIYSELSLAVETSAGVLDVSDEEVEKLKNTLLTPEAVRASIKEALEMQKQYRTTRVLEIIIAGSLANDASDVHIEPREKETMIRFRLDGVLVEIATIDLDTYHSILVRIKLLSGLKINIVNAPQDGRFSLKIDKREIELRTSIMPGGDGESIVMRLLDPHSIGLSLEELGFRPFLMKKIIEEINKPNGMVLITGPTGSGKTTSLYAFLKKIMTPDIKILTIEDPIEYHLEGVVQTQVDHEHYTFAGGLRSALRQDPDVIMVGEIRDEEVAETAVHAALTGHLVFSTLHTNNAAGAFPRLINIGIDPSMAGSAVNLVMAQRLVRRIVPEKSHDVPLEGEDKVFIERILARISDRSLVPENIDTMKVPNEDEKIPYKGRVAVYEGVFMSRSIEEGIRSNLTIRELEEIAREQKGYLSMHEDAALKVLEGVTTVEEVRRVLGENIGD
jgi:type IV pilus assembly protein PilB